MNPVAEGVRVEGVDAERGADAGITRKERREVWA